MPCKFFTNWSLCIVIVVLMVNIVKTKIDVSSSQYITHPTSFVCDTFNYQFCWKYATTFWTFSVLSYLYGSYMIYLFFQVGYQMLLSVFLTNWSLQKTYFETSPYQKLKLKIDRWLSAKPVGAEVVHSSTNGPGANLVPAWRPSRPPHWRGRNLSADFGAEVPNLSANGPGADLVYLGAGRGHPSQPLLSSSLASAG